MIIEFPCRCGHRFRLEDDQAGLDIQCPKCGLLNDVPTHGDLAALGEDGTYRLETGPEVPNPELAAELAYLYRRGPVDLDGNEKNLKLTRADIESIGGDPIPLKDDIPTLEDSPRYDPETGELITPLELKPSEFEPVNPATIPMALPALNYASGQTAGRVSFAHAVVHLLSPVNLMVMLAIYVMHVLLFPVMFVTFMGFFIVSIGLFIFIAALFAHYGNVIEDIGPFEKDELPRPVRDLHIYEDIWHPFSSVMASLVICYVPGIFLGTILAFNGHEDLGRVINLGWQAMGTFFLPAILLSLQCSGTILNLRPDRVMGVISECGAGYLLAVVMWVLAAVTYLWGMVGSAMAMVASMGGSTPLPNWMISWAVVLPMLAVGIFLMHYFCVCLGLMYRVHHQAFPWVFQRHVSEKKTTDDRPPMRPVPRVNGSKRPRRANGAGAAFENAIPLVEAADPRSLIGRWLLVRSGNQDHGTDSTEFLMRPDGTLDYISFVGGEAHIVHLTYAIEEDYIVTNQLSSPKEVRTRYWFDAGGNLVLELGGQRNTFRRAAQSVGREQPLLD